MSGAQLSVHEKEYLDLETPSDLCGKLPEFLLLSYLIGMQSADYLF
jgi:hypothetical protein